MVSAFQPQEKLNERNNKNVCCIFCKSENTVKKGFRGTMNRGKIQRFSCKNCGKNFCKDEGFYRMRNSEAKITKAVDLYFSNLSSRKVRNNYRRHENTAVSHVTVLDWCRKYAMKVQKLVDRLQPQLSGQYYADETEINRGKNNDIFWCSVDWGTRFINATFYSPNNQNILDASRFMERIKHSGSPQFIQTDYANFYPEAVKNVFGRKAKHYRNNVSKSGKHNVRIETVFSKIKDRVDDFRGLKALWSAPILMAGIVLQHNFIENHTTTGKLPCELAGLKLEAGINRWLGLIKLSSQSI